jgi:hypothetical protein
VATGPSELLSRKKVWATIGLACARNGDGPRGEKRKEKEEKEERSGTGNGKKNLADRDLAQEGSVLNKVFLFLV